MRLLRWWVVACLFLIADALVVPGPGVGAAPRRTNAVAPPSGPTINVPLGITTGPDGALWFTNLGTKADRGSIGRISTTGRVTLFAGSHIDRPAGIAVGPDGALWFTNSGNNSIGRITTSGNIVNYR